MAKFTKEFLISTLKRFYEEHGVVPKKSDCLSSEILENSSNYQRYFGSWNNAILEAGLKITKLGRKEVITKFCLYCQSKYETKNEASKYCSRNCSNTHINKKKQRAVSSKICLECGKIHKRNSDFCSRICKSIFEMKNTSIVEMSRYKEQNKYRAIRDKAANFYKRFGKSEYCEHCGYDKHTENCHIKPVKDFSDNDTVWECNRPDNIVFLCRNCHWELDNGFLTIEEIKGK